MKGNYLSLVFKPHGQKRQHLTAHLQKAGFRAPQTVLWLQKVQFSE
jgi:hypothetical protein